MTRTALCAAVVAALLLGTTATATAQDNNPYLEAIGALAASQVYTTFLYVGVTADAFEKKVYKAKQVRGMMDEMVGAIGNVTGYLEKVKATNIVERDKAFVTEMVQIFALIRKEALALKEYAGTGAKGEAAAFAAARDAARPRIKKLLGIKK